MKNDHPASTLHREADHRPQVLTDSSGLDRHRKALETLKASTPAAAKKRKKK